MLSVVIPNWNGASHLPTCLNALNNQTIRDFEVIVVDNASSDESCELIERKYATVRVIRLTSNAGFTGACNVGIRAAHGNIIALLNNDTEAADNWLQELASAFDRYQDAGILASRLIGSISSKMHVVTALSCNLRVGCVKERTGIVSPALKLSRPRLCNKIPSFPIDSATTANSPWRR